MFLEWKEKWTRDRVAKMQQAAFWKVGMVLPMKIESEPMGSTRSFDQVLLRRNAYLLPRGTQFRASKELEG